MAYGVFWKYDSAEGVKVVTCHPGAFADSDEEAKEDGRKILVSVKKEPLTPLCVVQTTPEVRDAIVQTCDELYLGDDEDPFYDVSSLPNWKSQPWWPL